MPNEAAVDDEVAQNRDAGLQIVQIDQIVPPVVDEQDDHADEQIQNN